MKSKHQLHVHMFQERHSSILNIVTAKQMHALLGNPKEVDDEGLLMDVDVQLMKMCHHAKTNDVMLTISFSPLPKRLLMERLKNTATASSARMYHIPQ